PGEYDCRGEYVVLEVCLGTDQPVAEELRDQWRNAVIPQPAGMDRSWDEVVPESVHRHEWGQLARVAEVVREHPPRQRRARGGLTREHIDLATGDLLAQERKREAGKVRAASNATDD